MQHPGHYRVDHGRQRFADNRRLLDRQRVDTDFVYPFVMTILGNPAHQLYTPIIMQHLTGNPSNVPANELWTTAAGPL